MVRDIVTYPDPILAAEAGEVEEVTPEIQALIDDMVETMYAKEGVGLAAPQVGRSLRIITVDPSGPSARDALTVLINPRITCTEGEQESEERCLSVVDATCTFKRAQKITVEGLNKNGDPVTLEFEDFPAIVFQHEIDHLHGVLIIDHVSRLKRALYDKKVRKRLKRA
ncbi:MAG: peptide deformylase [Desulfovibrionales bacterium]|jgi:peptide deformylase|nr:peptide deformylase [Desulfovibrionales bacterium]